MKVIPETRHVHLRLNLLRIRNNDRVTQIY